MVNQFGGAPAPASCPCCGAQPAASAAFAQPGAVPGMGFGAGVPYGQGFGPAFAPPAQPPFGLPFPAPVYPGAGAFLGGIPSDDSIQQMIFESLDSDSRIPADADIDVDVLDGVVTLSGNVRSKLVKHAAGDDAWWLPDVIDVNNQLTVTPRKAERAAASAQAAQAAPSAESAQSTVH